MGDKMKKLWLTSLFFLLIISSFQAILYSQILGSIKGHVYDKETKVPLEKVIVTIISQKSEAIQYKLITDKKGYFYKSGLHIGIYMIKFEKKGYAPGATTIRIGIGSKEDLKISLPPFKGKKKGSNRIVEQSAKLINSGNFSEAPLEIFNPEYDNRFLLVLETIPKIKLCSLLLPGVLLRKKQRI